MMITKRLTILYFICVLMTIFILFPLEENYAQSVYIKNLASVENEALLSKIVVLPDERNQWDEATGIIERLSELPESLLQSLEVNQIRIKLFTGSLTDQREASHLKGIQPRGYSMKNWDEVPGMGGGKTVLVKIGYSEKGMDHDSVNLELHELGHSVDQIILNNSSKTSDFQVIWSKEVQNLFPNQSYFIDYPEEYFAECFAMFYYNDKTRTNLLLKAPLTYKFLDSMEKNDYTLKEQQ